MARNESESGCGPIIGLLIMLAIAFVWGLSLFGDQRQWWHYLAALPLGILVIWVFYSDGAGFLLKWFTIPVGGILLLIWLFKSGHYLWTVGAGIAFIIIGVFCRVTANRQKSTPWATNSLAAYLIGVVMLIGAGVVYFI